MLDLVSRRNWFFLASIVIMIPGLISLAIPPRLKPGIEFTSGTTFAFTYKEDVSTDQVEQLLDELGYPDAHIQRTGDNAFLVRTDEIEGSESTPPVGPSIPSERENLEVALSSEFGGFVDQDGNPTRQFSEFNSVSAAVSREIGRNAAIAIAMASLAITLYIAWAFRNVPNSLRYGISAIVALLHDVVIVIGIFSILGKFANIEVDTFFITGLLTVMSFSVHDSIVVFDRVRENVSTGAFRNFPDAVNHSLLQTIGRSLNTSLTLIFAILALLLLGGESIRDFLLVLLIGVSTGVYSSVFIAAMFLVSWDQGDFARLWRRITGRGGLRVAGEAAAAD